MKMDLAYLLLSKLSIELQLTNKRVESLEMFANNTEVPTQYTRCLKITEKVSFYNITSEASGQKFIKNAKNGQIDEFFFLKNSKLRSTSVTRQVNFD